MGENRSVGLESTHYLFDREIAPAITVKSGSEVTIRTERADDMVLSKTHETFTDRDEVVESGPNPVTGPIFVTGARPGDFLKVAVLEVTPCPDGSLAYVTYVPGPSSLVSPFSLLPDFPPKTYWVRVEGDKLVLPLERGEKTIETRPMIGTIGTAPKRERVLSYWSDREYGGNVDCPLIRAGNEVVLPVNVEGGLLSVGDVHARQGDGEVSCCAVECRGEVKLRIDVVPRDAAAYFEWPQVNGADFIGSIGCVKHSMDRAVEAALLDLVRRIERFYSFSTIDAYEIVGQCVELRVCQAVYPHFTCLAMIDRKYLA